MDQVVPSTGRKDYQHSGIEWLGEIPAHWEIKRGKWLFKRAERPVRPEDEIVTAFRDGTVTLRSNRRIEGFTNAIQENGYQGIRKGDLVIHAMDAFAGAIGVSDSDGKSTPVYSACISRGNNYTNNHYYAYLLRFMSNAGYIESLAKGIRERSSDFRFDDFGRLKLPVPPPEEQDRIANFLCQRTAEIDVAIAKKQRLVELLKEQKAIVINQAVTKGLNPDVPMRETGFVWLPEVPEHWKETRLKFATKFIVDCLHATPAYDEHGEYPAIRTADIVPGRVNIKNARKLNFASYQRWIERAQPLHNDILYSREGERYGIAAPVPKGVKLCISQRMMHFRADDSLNPIYLMWQLNCQHVRLQASIDVTGATSPHVNISTIRNYFIVTPPRQEQDAIVDHIATLCKNLGGLMQSIEKKIVLLKELREVVIHNAVLGRVKL